MGSQKFLLQNSIFKRIHTLILIIFTRERGQLIDFLFNKQCYRSSEEEGGPLLSGRSASGTILLSEQSYSDFSFFS